MVISAIDAYSTLGNIQFFYVPFEGNPNELAYSMNDPYMNGSLLSLANPDLG